jgi:hypothetical protein
MIPKTTKTTDAAPPAPAAPAPTPAQGGSYTLDDVSGTLTLVDRTQKPQGRAAQATPTTKE